MYRSNATVPTIPAYLVCEAEFIRKYGLGVIYPGTRRLAPYVKNGTLRVADTLEGLAHVSGIDAAGLVDTVRHYNADAVTGIDTEFGKGTTELNRFNGDPAHFPNPCMAPLEHGPFCAMPVWPAEIACSAGLETDIDGVVRRADGSLVYGLYACGNDMASIMNGTYPGPGTTLGPALVFAYRIAKHAKAGRLHGKEEGIDAINPLPLQNAEGVGARR
jgi:succinate dehydrogenase/fumarate reductase flavoprotein subunit